MSPTKYVELKRIKELLTCGICYTLMDTSVMTLCSHNYCSLCIRRYLLYKTQCPICFTETFEKDLRTNKILDEIITQYLNVEGKLEKEFYHKEIEAVKNDDSKDTCSLSNVEFKKETHVPSASGISHKDSDNPTVTISTPRVQRIYHQDISSPSTSTSPKIPSIFTPKSKKGFRNQENCKVVTCPVCKVDVPENNINKHLDDCLKRENTKDQPKKVELKRKPLAKLVLSLMKESGMRKKLKEFGLSSQGDRRMLENRLQRYIILYNAECDKINPRSVSELIKQCEEEEHLEKKMQKPLNVKKLNINRNTEHNVIEQQRKIYLTEYKDSFDQIIARIKTADNARKFPVRREILSKGNSGSRDCAKDRSTVKDSEKDDLLRMNSYIDDSDSNTSCPLQVYSSEDPMNFLTVELSSSSNDNSNQSGLTSKQDTSNVPCNINSTLVSSIEKAESIKTELSSENTLIHKEVASNLPNNTTNAFHAEECDVLENRINIHAKKSCSKLSEIASKSRKEAELLTRRNNDNIRHNQGKYDIHYHSVDKWREELRDEVADQFIKDIKHDTIIVDNIDDIDDRLDEESKQQLCNAKEYTPHRIKFEKENMESMDGTIVASASNRSRDNTNALRKRERDMTFVLSDDERIADRSMHVRKSARFGLSETIRFNNENFGESTVQIEEESRKEKVQLRATCARSVNNSVKRSTRLRSKINREK
ncbi:E3 ubiquitin-protein ligase RAD18-like [Odontomachus brunneus]|uniref:E3 ubiquitin-protein ligase RAD18-like n=1 Tax=Odontomachus brunneus TaxID=486640 RepID=UPI0013F25248|nr:E3 ubiquitin-protein ligase RAD18-like [Odontomachus brunneus]